MSRRLRRKARFLSASIIYLYHGHLAHLEVVSKIPSSSIFCGHSSRLALSKASNESKSLLFNKGLLESRKISSWAEERSWALDAMILEYSI